MSLFGHSKAGVTLPLVDNFSVWLSCFSNMQICSAAVGLDLVVEFVYVECRCQQDDFGLYFYLASQEKTAKPHVLFQHAKRSFNLNGTIYPQ